MLVLIWATLLLSVRGSSADTGASGGGRTFCYAGYCVTLREAEVTAEAGLCVVIPCSFSTPSFFTPTNMVWYKCEPIKKRCSDSDIIFHTNKNNKKVQSGFKGRVSLLEPDVRQNNCSIIISDLAESDSGLYQLRVNGIKWNGQEDGITFPPKTPVSVKDLSQRPTVVTPPLTEGQQTTLTCTAPGLCCGSAPKITWTWKRAGENDSHIIGNITAVKTDNVTAVTQRHSSTWTFNPSAEHHGTEVTCKVGFTGNTTTEETVTLNVTYVKEAKISGNPRVKEGETLNLSCSVESFPPSLLTWTKSFDPNLPNRTETNLQSDTLSDLQEQSGTATFSIPTVAVGDSGLYVCTVKHVNKTLKKEVDVAVIYMRMPVISGATTVSEGGVLNLTCTAESFPPSHITWTKVGSSTELHSGPDTELQNHTGSATLIISDGKVEHSGRYICTATQLDTAVTTSADVTVTWFPNILSMSGCELQSEVLTCVCISQGVPLPTIRWPLLENHTEYSVNATVSKHTVTSTITLSVKDHSSTVVECVSSSDLGEAKENLTIQIKMPQQKDHSREVMNMVSRWEVIIAFFIGVLLSAVLCWLAKKCHRTKQKSSGNLDQTLEMVTSQEDTRALIDAGQAVEDDQTYYQDAGEGDEAVAAEVAAPDPDDGPKDVEYASIDFTALKRKTPREGAKKQEATETEYAEIKKGVKEEIEDNGEEEGELMGDKEEEEEEEEEGEEEGEEQEEEEEWEAMMGEEEGTKHCVPQEEEGEEEAVYSNVKDIMGEI